MKIRNKLAVIIAPILLISIVLLNVVFGAFFRSYVKEQEADQINLAKENIFSYLETKESKYIGNLNDWAHWDDMYAFSQKENPTFDAKNLTKSTFINLDIDFLIITDLHQNIEYRKYYSFETDDFLDFPPDFFNNFKAFLKAVKNEGDNYGIFQIGKDFYFVALSNITDSLEEIPSDSNLVIGRQIDSAIIEEMNRITGCKVQSIKTANAALYKKHTVPVLTSLYNKDEYTINMELLVPNSDIGTPVKMDLDFQRDLFKNGNARFTSFALLNTLLSVVIAGFIIFVLGKLIGTPFMKLIRDVKNIDLTGGEYQRLKDEGNDEFNYLRKTINHLIERIESTQDELKDNKEKLQATLLSVGDGVISVDKDGYIQFLNPAAQALTGWKMEKAFRKPIESVFVTIHETTRERVVSPVQTVFKTQEVVVLTNHTLLVSKDGKEYAIENTAAPIKDSNGEIIGCVLVFRNVSEQREKQRRIEYLSYHDQLTGVYNRRYFEEWLISSASKENLPLSVLYIDVNGLKTINDAFGHEMGDHYIKQIAEVIKSVTQPTDIIIRTGGDEFIVFSRQTDSSAAEKAAGLIKKQVSRIRMMDIEISVSIGWDTKVTAETSIRDVLRRAEDMMYSKKIYNSTTKSSGIVQSIMHSLLIKNPRENAHSKRVSEICMKIGEAYGLSDDEIKELKTVGELHDIGKIAIDEAILNKEGSLTEFEWAQIKKHPETGYRLLGTSSEFIDLAEYIRAHHERWDGKGYPMKLKGEKIPWIARVICVADTYDAMTSDRPYRKALSKEEAVARLEADAGKQFDPDIVRVFIEKVLKTL